MESVVIIGLLALMLAAVAPALYALLRRMANTRRLELWRVLHRRGLSRPDMETGTRAFAAAVRRCALCPSVDACNEWLAGGTGEKFQAFCPNAGYLERLGRP